jgi:molecular chaperone GrpE
MENATPEIKNQHQTDKSKVELLQEELRCEHDMYLRALADFDNYRKRVERDHASAVRAGKRELILSLLNVVDNFERAVAHSIDKSNQLFDGIKVIYQQLLSLLAKEDVKPFQSVGKQFDPLCHEAISTIETKEFPQGSVYQEYQRGYLWKNELLRPARVRVVQ